MKPKLRIVLFVAFGLSGAAALIYEVVWTRALALILGSTTYAVSTMLSTFMAGLALGGWLGGKIADRRPELIKIFAGLEVGIGIFGLLTIWLVNALPPLYYAFYQTLHVSPAGYFVFQFAFCFLVMLVPTTLMGATFPIVSRAVTTDMAQMGRGVGNAYSFNTMGAIFGSFSAGFILIPLLGLETTTIVAACLNVTGAVVVLVLSRTHVKPSVVAAAIVALLIPAAGAAASTTELGVMGFYKAGRFDSYEEFIRDRSLGTVYYDEWNRDGRVRLWRDAAGFLVLEHGGRVESLDIDGHLRSSLPDFFAS